MGKNEMKTEPVTFIQRGKKITVKLPNGYRKLNERNKHGTPIYTNGKDYIFPDKDGHNGGIWKKAKNKKLLDKKKQEQELMMRI